MLRVLHNTVDYSKDGFIYRKWGYNKGTPRCPRPSLPSPRTFRGKGRDCSHTCRYITSSTSTSAILFPQHKTKTSREIFFFQCLLSIYFLLLPLCLQQRQCFPSFRPQQLRICLAPQSAEDCRGAGLPLQLAIVGLVQSWGEQGQNAGNTSRGSHLGQDCNEDPTYHLGCASSRCLKNWSFKLPLA